MEVGRAVSGPHYVEMIRERGRLVRERNARLMDFDALVIPEVVGCADVGMAQAGNGTGFPFKTLS